MGYLKSSAGLEFEFDGDFVDAGWTGGEVPGVADGAGGGLVEERERGGRDDLDA